MKEHCFCLERAGKNHFSGSHGLWVFPLVCLCGAAPPCAAELHAELGNPCQNISKMGIGIIPESLNLSLVLEFASSLLHLLNPRKLVIKITRELAFLGALPSVLMAVLDFHLKVNFFFKLVWLEDQGLERRKSPQMSSQETAGWEPLSFCSLCLKEPW